MEMLLNKNSILSEARICLFHLSCLLLLLLLFCPSVMHSVLCVHMSLQIYIITNHTLLYSDLWLNKESFARARVVSDAAGRTDPYHRPAASETGCNETLDRYNIKVQPKAWLKRHS